MDLFQAMRSFAETVQLGSMTAAARKLDVTPALVGQHIAALEEKLGQKLLHRTTRRQSLTSYGEGYYVQCRDILDRLSLIDQQAEAQGLEAKGEIRLTAPVSFGSEVLVPLIAVFRQRFPQVTFDITLSDRVLDIVEEGVDVAFRVAHVPDSRVIQRVLMPYHMRVCAAPEYLEKAGDVTSPEDLTQHSVIAFTPANTRPLRFSNGEQKVEVSPNYVVNVNQGAAVLKAAKAGMGVVIQPEVLVKDALADGQLVALLPEWRLPEREVSMVYYKHKHLAPKLREFIAFVQQYFS